MSEKRFLSWIGFNSTDSEPNLTSSGRSAHSSSDELSERPQGTERAERMERPRVVLQEAARSASAVSAGAASSTLERIRQLEAELADLRSRRDITALSRDEFEILATETAMNLIRTAQTREQRALANAKKAVADTNRAVESLMSDAEQRARSAISSGENRGRKLVDAAESQAKEMLSSAREAVESLTEGKRREAAALAAAAKREAERLVADAHNDVVSFKNWLGNAIVEAERLHKVQSQSLSAAEEAIRQTRARLTTAFEKLESLGRAIDASIGADGRPVKSESTDESAPSMRSAARRTPVRRAKPAPAKAKGATKVDPKKQAASKVAPKTSAKATSKPSAKKVASKRK